MEDKEPPVFRTVSDEVRRRGEALWQFEAKIRSNDKRSNDKDQSMEELDIVHSKTPPLTLDSSSGDTDLDADSSVLHINLNVDTGSALVSMDRHSNHALHRQRIRACQRRERLSHKKGSATMNSPTQAVAKPLTPDSEEVAKAVAALLSDEEVPAEGM